MAQEKMTLPLSSEQYLHFEFDVSQALTEMGGVNCLFDEENDMILYELFPTGMKNLIEWITGSEVSSEEFSAVMKIAEKHSVPVELMGSGWGRQFTEESLFDVAIAIATDTLDRI